MALSASYPPEKFVTLARSPLPQSFSPSLSPSLSPSFSPSLSPSFSLC